MFGKRKCVKVYMDEEDYDWLLNTAFRNRCSMSHCMVSFMKFYRDSGKFPGMVFHLKGRFWFHG